MKKREKEKASEQREGERESGWESEEAGGGLVKGERRGEYAH